MATLVGWMQVVVDANVADAFATLRNAARGRNQRLSDLAQAIIDGTEQIRTAAAPADQTRNVEAHTTGRHRSTTGSISPDLY